VETTGWAGRLAGELLAPLGDRWLHVQAVADQAGRVGEHLPPQQAELLQAAAWLHDVGYAPKLAVTGFHPLDGAGHLVRLGHIELAGLVAHHSCAHVEAEMRGLADQLARFTAGPAPVVNALAYCDMTSGPAGERVTLERRIEEVDCRYGSSHLVARSIKRARPCLEHAVRHTQELMTSAQAV